MQSSESSLSLLPLQGVSHIHFEGSPNGPFFRIYRSTTPPGEPPGEDRQSTSLRRSRRGPLLVSSLADPLHHRPQGPLWARYAVEQEKYLDAREDSYDEIDPDRLGPALDWVWDGDHRNRNALLNVFRHSDNANVRYGWIGQTPKTAWIVDFPIFERIYYTLVADFDVFGNVAHQVSTRLYMDHLRMQSETLYLAFMPAQRREEIRASISRDSWIDGGCVAAATVRDSGSQPLALGNGSAVARRRSGRSSSRT